MLAGLFDGLTVLGAVLAVVILALGLRASTTDVSMAATAALAVAVAVIPYVAAGALHRIETRRLLNKANRQRVGED